MARSRGSGHAGAASLKPETINAYLEWRERECGVERDLNGWRLVPVRFIVGGKAELTVRQVRVTVE